MEVHTKVYKYGKCVCVMLKHSILFVKYNTPLTEYVVLVYLCIYLPGDDLVEAKYIGGM